ncbi:MAG: IPT/TIG domain-containing protein, partial [Methanomicrobiales archaeon]|nr:IPT/TIG domain-containing protein [Methanomicrobiales archaeon]
MYRSESGKVPTMKGSAGSLILGMLLVVAICILPVQAADNPVPVVTKISPTYTDAGVSSVTLTITGSGFVTGSVVQWNGMDKPTTFVSATKLTAKIPGEDLRYPTTAKVRVYTPAPGGGYSKEYTFTVKAAYWIKSIWPAVVELDPLTLKLKGPNSYWEVNKANADPYGDYIFGLGVTGSAASPQVYFLDAQTKFPSSTTKNSVWKLDMTSGKSTKVQALPKFAMGLGVPSPTVPNLYYYAEGKNVHIIENGAVVQSKVFPANIGGIDVVADPTNPFLLAISRDLANQKVYRVTLDPVTGRFTSDVVTHLIIKATSRSTLYPYSYTGIAYARIMFGGSERQVIYVTK